MSQPITARSPWAGITEYSSAAVKPVTRPLNGHLNVPGSKSYTNRALIIAALAEGPSVLKGVLKSDDSYWCKDALVRLGLQVEMQGDTLRIHGEGGRFPKRAGSLFIGASGTIARFLPGALAAAPEGEWLVDGIEQLQNRPVQPLVQALRDLGGHIEYVTERPGLPLRIAGTGLDGGEVRIPGNVSSQFLSGLLIASPYANKTVRIEVTEGLVQPSYVQITVDLMRQFGAEVEAAADLRSFEVRPAPYQGQETVLEADASTACYFLSLAALTGGTVRVTNVGYGSAQPDARFIDVLERMGCTCTKADTYLEVTGPEQLTGGFDVDMKPMSDQALTVAALAPFADKPVRVYNVAHIRKHESDRIAVICAALKRIGIHVEEFEDGFRIHPGTPHGAVLDPHDDHRNAMVFGLLGTRVPGVRILDPGCVSKTCPAYFSELEKLGIEVQLSK